LKQVAGSIAVPSRAAQIGSQPLHRFPQQLACTAPGAARNPRKRRARILPPETHPAKRAQHLLAHRGIVAAISTSATIRTNTIRTNTIRTNTIRTNTIPAAEVDPVSQTKSEVA
jgi:hypothetical protein